MNPRTAVTLATFSLCPFAGAALAFGWLQLDAAPTNPPAVVQPAETVPADELVTPLLPAVGPEPPTAVARPPETAASAAQRPVAASSRPSRVETPTRTPAARPVPAQTSETPDPAPPAPEPEPEAQLLWTQADQAAADARCEASLPGSRATNTPEIGDTYDPTVRYPCAGNLP